MEFLFVDGDLFSTDTEEILEFIENENVAIIQNDSLDLERSVKKLAEKLSGLGDK